jgi:hypothetical protein
MADGQMMNRILLVDNSLITVWVYPAKRLIHHQMKAYCYGTDFREGLARGLEAMEQHHATKWLSDNRATSALPPDDEEWLVKSWFPRAKAAGWKRWGIVKPAKLIGQVYLDRLARRYIEHGIEVRMFGDPDEVMAWLDEI